MKKRTIIILGSIVLAVLLGAIAGFLFWRANREEKPTAEDLASYQYISCIQADSCTQLRQMAEEQELTLLLVDENVLALNGAVAHGQEMNITFEYQEDTIEMVYWGYDICAVKDVDINDQQALAGLQYDIDDIVSLLGVILEENIDAYWLYSAEGYPVDTAESSVYGQLLTGETVFDLTIKDQAGAVWNARTHLSEDGILSVHFYRSLRKEFNEQITADIILE